MSKSLRERKRSGSRVSGSMSGLQGWYKSEETGRRGERRMAGNRVACAVRIATPDRLFPRIGDRCGPPEQPRLSFVILSPKST